MSSRVGKYELGRALGAGGMAEVFVATVQGAEGFTRPVAIKRVLAEHSRQPAFAEMFVNEARLAAMLRHENVVQTLDFDRDDEGRLYLVMELVEGRDLDQLAHAGPLPWPVLIHVLASVLRGLGHAHDLVVDGKPLIVVHRDVSPHNVLVSWDGTVKVSDFGIAKAVAATGATRSGAIKGKPAYMSPEQIMGAELDGRSDLFAVGVMMWELLTCRPLFAGGSIEETFARLLHQPITRPAELVPGLPPELDAIAMTLLARDRDLRFQHARDAVTALEAAASATVRGRELLAELLAERFPDKAPPRTGVRPTGGVRTPIGAGPGARVATAASLAEAAGVVSATPVARGSKLGLWLALAAAALAGTAVVVVLARRGPGRTEHAGAPRADGLIDAGGPRDAAPPADAALAPIDADASAIDASPIDAAVVDGGRATDGRRVRAPVAGRDAGSSTIQDIPMPPP